MFDSLMILVDGETEVLRSERTIAIRPARFYSFLVVKFKKSSFF